MIKSILLKIKKKMMRSFSCFYDNGNFYTFLEDGGVTESHSSHKKRVILLSRASYSEHQKKYPVQSKKELIQIVNLELQGTQNRLYLIGDYENKFRTVTFAKLNEQFTSHTNVKGALIIPETWLMGCNISNEVIKFEAARGEYWLYQSGKKVFSHAIKGQFRSKSSFCAAIGIKEPGLEEVKQLKQRDVIKLLEESFLNFSFSNFKGLLYSANKSDFNPKELLIGAGVFAALGVLYLKSVSFYLENKLENMQKYQGTLAAELNVVLDTQKRIEEKIEKIKMINDNVFIPDTTLTFWRDIHPFFVDSNVALLNLLMLPNGSIRFSGNATRASDVLQAMSKQPLIKNPEFASDVVEINGKERFSISYLRQKADEGNNNE